MSDSPRTSSTTRASFTDFVLRSVMTAPEAYTDPSAARVLARLLAVIGAEGGDDAVGPYLAAVPGEASVFEVRLFRPGDLTPATVSAAPGPVAALRTALRLAREGDGGVEVLSRQVSADVDRCVLVRDATGELEFRFPRAETLIGSPQACSSALRIWESTLNEWSRSLSRDGDGLGRIDLASEEPGDSPSVPGEPVAVVAPVPGIDAVIEVLEGFFSSLTIEVDLGQIEQLVRQAVDLDRREIVEPVADRVAEILGPLFLARMAQPEARHPDPIIVGVPSASEVAEVVSAQVGALLSETILSRRHGETGGQPSALRGIASAVELLTVQLDAIRDEVRRSAQVLTTIDERLETTDRRGAVTERVITSVDQEVQRLAHRIDEQVSTMVANAEGGSELSDGVARLTRKLRQSVAQLDRALVRLDELFDEAEDRRTTPAPARRTVEPGPPGPPRTMGPVPRR